MTVGYSSGLGGGDNGPRTAVAKVANGTDKSAGFTRPTSDSWISSLQFKGTSNITSVRILASVVKPVGDPAYFTGLNVIPYTADKTELLIEYSLESGPDVFWSKIAGFSYFVIQTEIGGVPTNVDSDIEIIVGWTG